MDNSQHRLAQIIATTAGGSLAAAFLRLAVASADNWVFTPDVSSLMPTQIDGLPPLFEKVIGAEDWNLADFSKNMTTFPDSLQGVNNQLTFGSFINDEFLYTTKGVSFNTPGEPFFEINTGSQFDLMNFGGGFENAWMDLVGGFNPGARTC